MYLVEVVMDREVTMAKSIPIVPACYAQQIRQKP